MFAYLVSLRFLLSIFGHPVAISCIIRLNIKIISFWVLTISFLGLKLPFDCVINVVDEVSGYGWSWRSLVFLFVLFYQCRWWCWLFILCQRLSWVASFVSVPCAIALNELIFQGLSVTDMHVNFLKFEVTYEFLKCFNSLFSGLISGFWSSWSLASTADISLGVQVAWNAALVVLLSLFIFLPILSLAAHHSRTLG